MAVVMPNDPLVNNFHLNSLLLSEIDHNLESSLTHHRTQMLVPYKLNLKKSFRFHAKSVEEYGGHNKNDLDDNVAYSLHHQ